MMVGAGVRPGTEERIPAELAPRQAEALGLAPDAPELGCGLMACAYLADDGAVAKITRDVRDARMSWVIMGNPQPWAIPIHGVWRLGDGLYAIRAARAEPLRSADPRLAEAMAEIYANVAALRLPYGEWDAFREATEANIDDDVAETGADEFTDARREALALADEAVAGFARLGMAWLDFHPGNWGVHGGRPVVIDLGLSDPLEAPPVRALERRAARELPGLR